MQSKKNDEDEFFLEAFFYKKLIIFRFFLDKLNLV